MMEGGGGGTAVVSPQSNQGFFHRPRLPYREKSQYYRHHHYYNRIAGEQGPSNATNFDGKRMRKSITRKTVDYNSSVIRLIESRIWQRDSRDVRWVQPDPTYSHELSLPETYLNNPINAVTTRFVRTSTNKIRCPIFCCAWTPEGRRLVTGASSGEFTLWNGLTFNFETILQAHDYPVRAMTWSHNDLWLLTGDHFGYVKYWQSNMNNVKMYQAHKDQPIRGASFSPTDSKVTTCADDGTVRIFDFHRCHEERVLRGHGAEVRCVDWHPQKGLIVSGSKDSQQPIKLWDPRASNPLATLHAHKSTVMAVRFNQNGNWLLTASRDHVCKLFDIRSMKEMYTFRGHKKEATAVAWHPIHETMFATGGSDGSLLFWEVGNEKEVASVETAHDSIVWNLAWHPLGHILASASNDHTTKFWTRNRPGDRMRDRYNLNMLPIGTSEEMLEFDDDTSALPAIPGMGLEHGLPDHLKKPDDVTSDEADESLNTSIPGLDSSMEELAKLKPQPQRKVPYAKPIPAEFQRQWDKIKAPGIAPQQLEANREEEERKRREENEAEKMAAAQAAAQAHQAAAQAHQAAMMNASENSSQLGMMGMGPLIPGIPSLMEIHVNGPSSAPPGLEPLNPNVPLEMMRVAQGEVQGFPPHSSNQLPLDQELKDFVGPGPEMNLLDEGAHGDVDLRQGFTDVDMRQQFHDPPPPNRFEGNLERAESPPGGWGNRTVPMDGPHQDFDMRQQRGPLLGNRMGEEPPFDEPRITRLEERNDSPGVRRDDFGDEDLRQTPGPFHGGGPPRGQLMPEEREQDPFGGFEPKPTMPFLEQSGFGPCDEDMRDQTRSPFGQDEPFDQDFRSKGLLPRPEDRDDRGPFGDHDMPHDGPPHLKRTWNDGPGGNRDLDRHEQFGNFGPPDSFGPHESFGPPESFRPPESFGPGPGPGNRWRGGLSEMRGRGEGGMRGRGEGGMRGRGEGGMRGRGEGGMRGRGEGGMRGRADPGMRGRGEPGMRGRGGQGFRGPFRGGMGRGGMGRGGMGRGGMGRGGPGW